jgi:hypothetical protein
MRSIIVAMAFLTVSVTVNGQVIISILFGDKLNTDKITFGLMLGNCWNSMSGYAKASAQSNFSLGLFLNVKLKQRLFIQFDALAKFKTGAKGMPVYTLGDPVLDSMFSGGSVQRELSCVGLVSTIQYRIWKNGNLELGPQVLLRLKAKDIFVDHQEGGDLKFEKDIGDAATRFDVGITGGISWQFSKGAGVKLGLRYYEGLIDLFQSEPRKNATRTVQFNVYVPVGREKAKKKNGTK